ncbi:MAG: alpha amylase C-terminal domain-containing protein [Spirochaetales bacterium]|nr:alpha amylase C-terminal domain-containing protein [Spirochaetales bacterium]
MEIPGIIKNDPYLQPYTEKINYRIRRFTDIRSELYEKSEGSGRAYEYYGEHRLGNSIVIREWAPNASAIFLICDHNNWRKSEELAFRRLGSYGDWEIIVPEAILKHGSLYRLLVEWSGGQGERIPAYARRVVQDPQTYIFSTQVWFPKEEYRFKYKSEDAAGGRLFIYEAHIGMAVEEGGVGTFSGFREHVLPRIISSGFNTIQLMALMEHPFYGSFGYQVSSFFALSSRYGTPEEFKQLVDECHKNNIRVIMDLVHSHAVKNEVEGISKQDGSDFLYFHEGGRGDHPAWDSRCFNYGKPGVRNFLLSNCAWWIEEYNIDGYRFDGVTSMLYNDHGLGVSFDHYDKYFDENVDEDAVLYLALANDLIHRIKPEAITIAEDMSGLPGIAAPLKDGGCGFDYRLTMGIPDYWIKLLKEVSDENWNVSEIWNVMNNRRFSEKHIAYCESHDQALVGDKTLIFRLIDADMYSGMSIGSGSVRVERGIALIKIINLLTMSAAGDGYLNFMGNEFGHPEWIDFPREGNGWSYHYARRQWSLADNKELRYSRLLRFSSDMLKYCAGSLNAQYSRLIMSNNSDQILAWERGGLIFVINLNSKRSFTDYGIEAPAGKWVLVLNSDSEIYDGHGRIPDGLEISSVTDEKGVSRITPYIPSRTAQVFKKAD